ncbi:MULTISPECIES: ProQ/FINO family protein [Providencia]|uniref:ProQ/FINO family protein n=1 Tax=Providencia rettgeri TaxID=587 RepID=A0AB35LHH6_PRORE|nr:MULTISPECIES: ProQ/FINO family protein [Providencia]MBI6203633.1 conjugal transfer protein [Providencia rettgeri]MBO8256472.1 conjugal transfer protein [Providencia rettgeri]MBO8260291.1 conjugal transfer protein [Providencia rettgeri]MCG5282062.1 ProQ/FINO family protein [Providencia rettgeri]MCL0007655.1 ProQ/FINO family protein [Providencia rettgeri]
MERKTLTLKRSTIEKESESTEPVIQRRRKQVVVNTQRKSHKLAKTAPIQPPKKETSPPAKNQKAVVIPLEKKVILPTPPKKHLPLEEAIANISAYWPQLFPNGQLRPMAVGTREALFADKKVRELPISYKKLKRSLAAISYSVKYRTTIMPGAVRYDKDGQPNGTVTESDVADTLKRIQRLAKQQSRSA